MLKVRFNASAPRSRLNQIATGISAAQPAIMQACGLKLMGLAALYFQNMSSGGQGYSGRRWPSATAATVARRTSLARRGLLRAPIGAQGVITGEMQRSLSFSATTRSVSLKYDDPAAYWFNIHRRLIPSRLPRVWRLACDQIANQILLRYLGGS